MESKPALNRNRGGFGASDEMETAEPARTERLLARPFVLFPRVGADALESIAITVLFKCRGARGGHSGYAGGPRAPLIEISRMRQSWAAALFCAIQRKKKGPRCCWRLSCVARTVLRLLSFV